MSRTTSHNTWVSVGVGHQQNSIKYMLYAMLRVSWSWLSLEQHIVATGCQLGIGRTALWMDLQAADCAMPAHCALQNACILSASPAPQDCRSVVCAVLSLQPHRRRPRHGVNVQAVCDHVHLAALRVACCMIRTPPPLRHLHRVYDHCPSTLTKGVPGTAPKSRLCATTSQWYSFKAYAPCCSTQV